MTTSHRGPARHEPERTDSGYLVVEAAVAIPIYVFFVLAILQISSFAIAQAKIAVAVNSAAMEISQYAYVRDDSLLITNDASVIIEALNSFSSGLGGSGDIFGVGGSENPMAQLINASGNDREVARDILRKHLRESDSSLASMGVVGGASGVDLTDKTSVLGGDKVVIDATYQLQLTFFWDVTIDMQAHATTGRWGDG